ncbi:hypothetical protein VNO78_03770 [Psophocarpus tetragonolobus]|uniref:beta-ketoacyl-[acyl-carrier-protein] synthase I n=1 Tax=Psophocarpus tetragonolobus TaxID=3891 RepID=A0AAN9T0Y8_PSOTE
MGFAAAFGNDVDGYYHKLLSGHSKIILIDTSKFPNHFDGQIYNFSSEGYIDGKNDRHLDDCLHYCIVASKKSLENAYLEDIENAIYFSVFVKYVPCVNSPLGGSSVCHKSTILFGVFGL